MKYRFEHTFFYEDKKLQSLNESLHNFGIPGKLGFTGNLGHTDIVFTPAPGKEFVPLSDDDNEKIRSKIEKVINEKLTEANLRIEVTVEKGTLLG